LFEIFILPIFVVVLLVILAIPLIFIYLFLRVTEAAFEQVGFDHWHASLAVFGSVLGSLVDIPLTLHPFNAYPQWYLALMGASGLDLSSAFHPVSLAVNLGGCIIPLIICLHLLLHRRASIQKAALGIAVVAVITYMAAEPVANEGILLPFWLSPVLGALCGLALARGYRRAPPLAYISGAVGTLLGADIMNLITPGVIPSLSPLYSHASKPLVLSIGGAGVFDGIFLTGIFSVLLAAAIVCLFQRSCRGLVGH
jgi:uncharacterized membrane protein